jgi:histidyl-tRNA synthetase
MNKPSLPQGTRDFSPEVIRKRNFIFDTIKNVFELFGFEPLETPAMENLETLLGKYGEEGDRLIFKILNNGLNDPKNLQKAKDGFEKVLDGKSTPLLTERALKYDLTIPFARYVAMNHGTLNLPFKRYQIQPVWRADRPQKGRYREFTQCDADVVGSASLFNEIELLNIYIQVFQKLKLNDVSIKINNRKLLTALAESCGDASLVTTISTGIDKLDKIGLDKVKEELLKNGILEHQLDLIVKYLNVSGNNREKCEKILALFPNNNTAVSGVQELIWILDRLDANSNVELDLTLARGLNYYTGTIVEVKAPEKVKIGSIGGGGRYDDLTGLFGVKGIPGVGISFGIDRIYDVMEELDLFPKNIQKGVSVIFMNMGEKESMYAFQILSQLRNEGISGELYPETAKLDKQFKYADKKGVSYAAIIGSKELETESILVKNLSSGEQKSMSVPELTALCKTI